MKLSELIREYVDLKIEGAPASRGLDSDDWRRRVYLASLRALEAHIDAAVAANQPIEPT